MFSCATISTRLLGMLCSTTQLASVSYPTLYKPPQGFNTITLNVHTFCCCKSSVTNTKAIGLDPQRPSVWTITSLQGGAPARA